MTRAQEIGKIGEEIFRNSLSQNKYIAGGAMHDISEKTFFKFVTDADMMFIDGIRKDNGDFEGVHLHEIKTGTRAFNNGRPRKNGDMPEPTGNIQIVTEDKSELYATGGTNKKLNKAGSVPWPGAPKRDYYEWRKGVGYWRKSELCPELTPEWYHFYEMLVRDGRFDVSCPITFAQSNDEDFERFCEIEEVGKDDKMITIAPWGLYYSIRRAKIEEILNENGITESDCGGYKAFLLPLKTIDKYFCPYQPYVVENESGGREWRCDIDVSGVVEYIDKEENTGTVCTGTPGAGRLWLPKRLMEDTFGTDRPGTGMKVNGMKETPCEAYAKTMLGVSLF